MTKWCHVDIWVEYEDDQQDAIEKLVEALFDAAHTNEPDNCDVLCSGNMDSGSPDFARTDMFESEKAEVKAEIERYAKMVIAEEDLHHWWQLKFHAWGNLTAAEIFEIDPYGLLAAVQTYEDPSFS
jgi:hypothetical protein